MPRKSSSHQPENIADQIRDMILRNKLRHVLPGERELARMFSVGRETIRKTLALLEESKWINPPHRQAPRTIRPQSWDGPTIPVGHHPMPPDTIGIISSLPIHKMPQSVLVELREIEKALEYDNLKIQIHEALWAVCPSPGKKLERLVSSHNHVCWILFRTSEETQLWFNNRTQPCLVRGITHTSSTLPFIDTHWEATTRHAASHLWHQGHRTSVLCIPNEPLKGNQFMQKGFMDFQGENWNPIPIHVPSETALLFDLLQETFDNHPDATSFVATRSDQIITLMSWAAAHSLAIPKDLSLICLTYDPILEHLLPTIACYKADTVKTIRRLIRMIRAIRSGKTVHSTFVIPDFHPGASISSVLR